MLSAYTCLDRNTQTFQIIHCTFDCGQLDFHHVTEMSVLFRASIMLGLNELNITSLDCLKLVHMMSMWLYEKVVKTLKGMF